MDKKTLLNLLLQYDVEIDDKSNGAAIDDISVREVKRAMDIVVGVLCRDIADDTKNCIHTDDDRNNWADKRTLKTHTFKATWTEYQEEWADNFSID